MLNGMGGQINVQYGRPNACPDVGRGGEGYAAWFATVDAKWDTNTYDCYPSYFDPDGTGPETSRTGIFHKYLTTRVDLVDTVGGSPTETTVYEYGGKPAWRWQEDLTGISHQIWNQWRGYGVVKTTHGTSTAAGGKTVVQNTYFRGMHGDRTVSGTPKNIVLTDWRGEPWQDRPSLQGRLLQSRTYSSDGATELSASQHRYWQDLKIDGPAWYDAITTAEDRVFTRERVTAETPGGTDTWRERQVERTFNTYGLPVTENERGDNLSNSADDKCTQTAYAQNVEAVGSWNYHVSRPSDVQTYHGPCGTGTLTGRVQTIYDGAASTDPAVNKPVDGNPTATITHHTTSNGGSTTRAEATYDAFGRPRSTTSPNEVGAATPRRTTITYAPSTGHPINGITTTNPAGHVTVTYPSLHHGDAVRVKDANDKWTHVAYDAFARPTKVWLPTEGGAATVPTGNPSHRFTYPATVSSPSQPTTPRQVLAEQLQSTWQTPAVYLPSYLFVDGFGRDRETQAPSPSGSGRMVTVTTYNDRGLPAVQSPPQFNSAAAGSGLLNPAVANLTSYTVTDYDDRERPWRARHYTGGATTPDRTTLTVDKGNRVETTPARGERTISYYDTFGRTTQIKKYSSPTAFATTSYGYSHSADGSRVDVTDPHTTITSFFSDLAGRRTKMIDPNAGTSEYWYDNNGNTIQTRDPAGTINTEYDVLDRPTVRRSTPPGGDAASQYESARWAYDPPGAKGHLSYTDSTTRTTIDGNTQDFTVRRSIPAYDGRYRPTSSNATLPTSSALGALSGESYYEEYVYDAADHVTRVVYPAIGDLPAENADTAFSAYGTPTTYTLTPDGGTALPVVTGVSWTGSGQLDKRTMASGAIRDIDWDESWRAPQYVGTYWQPEDQEWPFFWQLDEYTRDQVGNVTTITDHALWPTQSQCFWYDSWNRLTDARTTDPNQVACDAPMADTETSWNTGPDPYRAKWAYNANDDITTASVADITGTGTVAWTNHTYTRGDANHPSAVTGIAPSVRGFGNDAFGYDGAGRMTTRLTNGINHNLGWNPTHQLTSTKKINGSTVTPHRYAYDTSGGRVLKIGTDEVTAYFGDTQVTARLIAPGAGSVTGIRHYSQGGASVAKRNGGNPIRYLFDDIQGSATLAVDTGDPATANISRQRYTPYGATRGYANQLNIERGWLGQIEDDTTGLTYLGARYYDPAVARFISPDPLLRPGDPQTLNPYTYALNNPLTLSDPTGLEPGSWCTSGARYGDDHAAASACGVMTREKQTSHPMESGQINGVTIPRARPDIPVEVVASAAVREKGLPAVPVFGYSGRYTPEGPQAAAVYADALKEASDARGIDPHAEGAQFLADVSGWSDIRECFGNGNRSACAWLAAGFTPVGKVAKVAKAGRVGEVVAGSCRVSSFDPDTPVLMADGTKKPIKDVKIGDKVLATDPDTGKTQPESVIDVIASSGDKDMVHVIIKTPTGTGAVLATDQHPFWDARRKAWVKAENLRPGTSLRGPQGVNVTVIMARRFERSQTVLNLTVDNLHTYYVMAGVSPLLVHNDGEWKISVERSTAVKRGGPFGAMYYRQVPDSRGNVHWWSPDVSGHGNSAWKVYRETATGLEWVADAGVDGTYIKGKWKGGRGKFISNRELGTVNVKGLGSALNGCP